MHILLAGSFRKANSSVDFLYHAIKRAGCGVTYIGPLDCEYDEFVKVPQDVDVKEFVNNMETPPDLFLFVEGQTYHYFFPKGIMELEIPTAYWATDNYLNFRWNKEYHALFDYTFFVQENRIKLAQKAGADNLYWLPFAADEVFQRDHNVDRDIDVGYVGTVIADKKRYFDKLEKKGIKVETPETFVDEIGEYYSRCKIVYNICARFDTNVRVFEAPAAGALLINQANVDSGFYRIFTPGVNADVHDFDDAADVIRSYLNDPEKLKKVAKAGKKTVLEGHTYRHRLEEILRVTSDGVTESRLKRRDSYISNVKAALTYQHPNFRLRKRALAELKLALRKDFFSTILHIIKYAAFRVYEKAEKLYWKLGKAPV